jgi:lysophospholipase L1-like esterase
MTKKRTGSALRRGLKLVAGNLLVLFLMLVGLNFIAAVGYDARALLDRLFMPVSDKAARESLTDREQAETIFREFSQLETRYVPYLVWRRAPFSGETTTVGENGDRIHPLPTGAPLGDVRLFGGSTMWGKGVDDAHSIPAQLQMTEPRFRVYNHGESAFVSRQGLERLINAVNQDEPLDAAVTYDGCNDFYTLCREDTSINGHSHESDVTRRLRPPSYAANALFGTLRELIFYAWGRSLKAAGPPSRCQNDPEGAANVARTLINNWKIAKAISDANGIEFHAILQPVAAVGSANLQHLDYLADDEHSRSIDYRKTYPLVQQWIRAEGGGWAHDFTDAFDGEELLYIDGCHVNARGNEIIAGRIAGVLGPRLRQIETTRGPDQP